jgi:hypothetical protein
LPNPFSLFDNASVILAVICGLVLFVMAIFGAVLVYYAKKRQEKQKEIARDSQTTIPNIDPSMLSSYNSFYSDNGPNFTSSPFPQPEIYHTMNNAPAYPTMSSVDASQYYIDPNTNTYYVMTLPHSATPPPP